MPFFKQVGQAEPVELLPGEAEALLKQTYSGLMSRNIMAALRAEPGAWTTAGRGVLLKWMPPGAETPTIFQPYREVL